MEERRLVFVQVQPGVARTTDASIYGCVIRAPVANEKLDGSEQSANAKLHSIEELVHTACSCDGKSWVGQDSKRGMAAVEAARICTR